MDALNITWHHGNNMQLVFCETDDRTFGVDIGTGHQAMNTNSRESRTENCFQGGSQISS